MVMAGAGAVLLASPAVMAAQRPSVRRDRNQERKDGNMGNSEAEANLRADDPNLSSRARELIRIGEVGIVGGDQKALENYFHPDFRFHGPDRDATREQVWQFFAAYRAAFDDFSVTRQQVFSDGRDHLAAKTTFSGTFVRPLTGSPVGTVQPNGQPVFFRLNNIFRYADDGRLIEEWAQYDSRLLLERLGVRLEPSR